MLEDIFVKCYCLINPLKPRIFKYVCLNTYGFLHRKGINKYLSTLEIKVYSHKALYLQFVLSLSLSVVFVRR